MADAVAVDLAAADAVTANDGLLNGIVSPFRATMPSDLVYHHEMLELHVKQPRLNSSLSSAKAETDWLDLTRRMKAGDTEALAIYYEHFFDPMFREVQRLLHRDEQTSLDLVQESMMKAIRCIKPLPSVGAVAAWSKTVVRSTVYDWLRKQNQNHSFELSEANDGVSLDWIAQQDSVRMLWIEDQLKVMPQELQKLIGFRYRLGWSLRRIAESMGLKTGAVDGRIRRAVQQLQEKAKREFDE